MTIEKDLIGWEKWEDPTSHTSLSDDDDTGNIIKQGMPMLMTPIGPVPLSDNMRPGKNFNFWVGHTNFRLTRHIQQIIESVNGVEVLDICTPYRMRVGIGKMFTDTKVRSNISELLYAYLQQRKRITNDIS